MRPWSLLLILLVACGGKPAPGMVKDEVKVSVADFVAATQRYGPVFADSAGAPSELLLSLRQNPGSCTVGQAQVDGDALQVDMPWGVGTCPIGPAPEGTIHTGCQAAVQIVQVGSDGVMKMLAALSGTVEVTGNTKGIVEGTVHARFPAHGLFTVGPCTHHGTGVTAKVECSCEDASGKASSCMAVGGTDCCTPDVQDTESVDLPFSASTCAGLCECGSGAALCPCTGACTKPEPFPDIDCDVSCTSMANLCSTCGDCSAVPACSRACVGAHDVAGSNLLYGCLTTSTTCDSLDSCMATCRP